MHNTYHDIDDIHWGSMSFVATPDCSMLLNLMVRGNGRRTAYISKLLKVERSEHSPMTKPLKKALIHPMMMV